MSYGDLPPEGMETPEEGDFSLEEILVEYGGGRARKLLEDVEAEAETAQPAPAVQDPPAKEQTPPAAAPKRARRRQEEKAAPSREELRDQARDKLLAQAVDLETLEVPQEPRPISLEEVVGNTVDAVMEETGEPLLRPKRGLFSRREMEETEELYAPPEPEEEPDPEPIGPEMDLPDAAEAHRRAFRRRSGTLLASFAMALVPVAVSVADHYGQSRGIALPWWSGQPLHQAQALLACLVLTGILARAVFSEAAGQLARKRCTSMVLIALSALVSALDCVTALTVPTRTAVAPYGMVSCMALAFAQWGLTRESEGMYNTFRTAAMDDQPPYLVTETEKGACKQRGTVPGFYTAAVRDNGGALWQTVVLPVVLMASLVFAGITSLGRGRGADFFLNWSAILAAGATCALPLCWGLPWSRLARHLQKTGCAVAGWSGAEKISGRKSMIVTDRDLFPPGTIQLNGVKVFGEELSKACSYAATMARAADCGLERLFDGLIRSEGGRYETVSDFSFYEEGGYSATIRGESVLMGTASFMRKMDVRLPGGINLKTGVFLAVDRQLIAVFAVKYNAAENVDFALRMMRHNRVTPILAARDPNINPALLKRKFYKKVKVEYPSLSVRVALSEAEQDRGLPRALLLREGLLPYAETVVGSRRLCRTVRRCTALSLFSSAAGTWLVTYLVSLEAYSLLTPLTLLAFLLLWTLPVLLMSSRV